MNQTQYDNKTTQPDFEGTGPGPAYRKLDCKDYCPNILDVPCFLVKRCWSRLMLLLGLILMVMVSGKKFNDQMPQDVLPAHAPSLIHLIRNAREHILAGRLIIDLSQQ